MNDTTWKLIHKDLITDDLGIFRFRPSTEVCVPDFKCGEFANIGLVIDGKKTFRAYSITSSPFEQNYYEFYIKHKVHPTLGKITSALFDMQLGDLAYVQNPRGAFTIDEKIISNTDNLKQIILVASGTGLAPFISYLHYMEESNIKNKIILIHGVSSVTELGYRGLLEYLSLGKSLNLKYIPTISRQNDVPSKQWRGHIGRVESVIDGIDKKKSYLEEVLKCSVIPKNTSFYLCGYKNMIDNVMKMLKHAGFVDYQNKRKDGSFDIKSELYGI